MPKYLLFIPCRRLQNFHAMQTCRMSQIFLPTFHWSCQSMYSLHRQFADLWTSLYIALWLLH